MADTMGGEACTGEYVADGVVKLPPSVYVRRWGREEGGGLSACVEGGCGAYV